MPAVEQAVALWSNRELYVTNVTMHGIPQFPGGAMWVEASTLVAGAVAQQLSSVYKFASCITARLACSHSHSNRLHQYCVSEVCTSLQMNVILMQLPGTCADSQFIGWRVGSNTAIYSAIESPSNLVGCQFNDGGEMVQHGERGVVESFNGALVRIESSIFNIADGKLLHTTSARTCFNSFLAFQAVYVNGIHD